MELSKLKERYNQLKKTSNLELDQLISISNEISSIGSIVHKFFEPELLSINGFSFIKEFIEKTEKRLDGKKVSVVDNYILLASKRIEMKSPNQLMNFFEDNWSAEEQTLIEMFFSCPNIFCIINVGLYLEKK